MSLLSPTIPNNIFSLSLPLELSLVRVDSGGSVSTSDSVGLRPSVVCRSLPLSREGLSKLSGSCS